MTRVGDTDDGKRPFIQLMSMRQKGKMMMKSKEGDVVEGRWRDVRRRQRKSRLQRRRNTRKQEKTDGDEYGTEEQQVGKKEEHGKEKS